MADPGHYAEILGEIGRDLESESAYAVRMVDHGTYLDVSWQTSPMGGTTRTHRAYDVWQMITRARTHYCEVQRPRLISVTRTDMLCALGAECDRIGAELLSLGETEDGFQLRTFADGCHAGSDYSRAEIVRLIGEQRARRRSIEEEITLTGL